MTHRCSQCMKEWSDCECQHIAIIDILSFEEYLRQTGVIPRQIDRVEELTLTPTRLFA